MLYCYFCTDYKQKENLNTVYHLQSLKPSLSNSMSRWNDMRKLMDAKLSSLATGSSNWWNSKNGFIGTVWIPLVSNCVWWEYAKIKYNSSWIQWDLNIWPVGWWMNKMEGHWAKQLIKWSLQAAHTKFQSSDPAKSAEQYYNFWFSPFHLQN